MVSNSAVQKGCQGRAGRGEVTGKGKESSRVWKEGKGLTFQAMANLNEQLLASFESHLVAFRYEVPSSFEVQEGKP